MHTLKMRAWTSGWPKDLLCYMVEVLHGLE